MLQERAKPFPGLGVGGNPVVPAQRLPDVGGALDAKKAQFADKIVSPVDGVVKADLGLSRFGALPEIEKALNVLGVAGHEVLDELFEVGAGLFEALRTAMMALPHADHDADDFVPI